MKNKVLQITMPLLLGLLWLIGVIANIGGTIDFLDKFGIGKSAPTVILFIANAAMFLSIAFLLWQHFKAKNEDQVLMNAALSFIVQEHLGSMHFNDLQSTGVSNMAVKMAVHLEKKMQKEWGNKKYDDEIATLVSQYLSKLGYQIKQD